MAKYFLFGKYSVEALKGISSDRTKKFIELAEKLGGKVISIDVTLGCKDLVIAVDMPNTSAVMKLSIGMAKISGIGFTSSPAVSVEEFDKMMG